LHRLEFRQGYLIGDVVEPEFDWHSDPKLLGRNTGYPTRETWAFVQFDDHRGVRDVIGEGRVERLVNRGPAIDFAAAFDRRPFPIATNGNCCTSGVADDAIRRNSGSVESAARGCGTSRRNLLCSPEGREVAFPSALSEYREVNKNQTTLT